MDGMDFTIRQESEIFLVTPLTEKAKIWAKDFIDDTPTFGDSYPIEPMFLEIMTEAILNARFKILL